MLAQKVVDQARGVGPFGEEVLGPGQFDGVGTHPGVSREPENPNEREFGVYAARGLDPVHFGHRDIHQDDVRPERVRLRDRLESIGGLAHDLKLRPRLQQLT